MCRWWRQPDHYQWLSAYLATHHLQRFTRYMMAVIVMLMGCVPLLMLWSTSGPSGVAFTVTAIVVSTSCAVMAALWLARWPTRAQSTLFAVAACVCIAATCLAQPYPGTGLQTCAAFAALAGYVAFFRSTRLLAFTLAVASITAVICCFRVSAHVDVALASSKLIVLFVSILAVPFSAQVLIHILGADALKSDTDPLTGLPNRRGFHRSLRGLIIAPLGITPSRLAIVMIDLDDFKRINDTAGHAAGDRTLVAVADILRHARSVDSVIARIGGEEFVIAVVGSKQYAINLAEWLRSEIALLPGGITASIGIDSAPCAWVPDSDVRTFAESLVHSADRAMYKAKRSGGDQVYVVGQPDTEYDNDYVMDKPMPSSTTATNGSAPWITAERALSGDDAMSTTAAASIEPTPAKTKAAPTAIPPELIQATPTAVTIAKKRL
jgi:diguanylate cyclase (GGDEF)-like protein